MGLFVSCWPDAIKLNSLSVKITLTQTLKWTLEKTCQWRWKIPEDRIIFAPLSSFNSSPMTKRKSLELQLEWCRRGFIWKKKKKKVGYISPLSKSFSGQDEVGQHLGLSYSKDYIITFMNKITVKRKRQWNYGITVLGHLDNLRKGTSDIWIFISGMKSCICDPLLWVAVMTDP